MDRERINGIREIKTKEEYEKVKSELDSYLNEYKLFGQGEKSMKAIEKAIVSSFKRYEEERDTLSKEQELAVLGEIQLLKNRYNSISDGTFEPKIKQNITACILALEAYDAKLQDRSALDVIKGIFQGDAETKEYLRRKYTLAFANVTGAVPGITNMNLAPMSEILDTISRNYDLVGIEIPKQETSIVPSFDEKSSGLAQIAFERCQAVLKERGLVDASTKETKNKEQNPEESVRQSNSMVSAPKLDKRATNEKDEKDEGREIEE